MHALGSIKPISDDAHTGAKVLRNYIDLMIRLSKTDSDLDKDKFLKEGGDQTYARVLLTYIGIKIPDDIPIFFDKENTNRPSLWIVKGEQAFKVNEKLEGFRLMGTFGDELKGEDEGYSISFKLDTGNVYKIALNDMKTKLGDFWKIKDKKKRKDTVEKYVRKLVESQEGVELEEQKEIKRDIFSKWQIDRIKEYYKERNLDEDDFMFVVRLPFYEINDNLVITYQLGGDDEVVLSSC